MLIQLGTFQFSISTAAYSEIERVSTFQFAEHSIIGNYSRLQATGPNNDTLRITGNYIAGLKTIIGDTSGDPFQTLRRLGLAQRPLQLQTEDGKNHGYWVLYDLNISGSKFLSQGALQAGFTVQLKYYGRRLQ